MDEAFFTCTSAFSPYGWITSICSDTKRCLSSKLDEIFLKQHQQKSKLSKDLHHELEKLLKNLSEQEAVIFVYSLASNERIGRTYQQMAEWMKEDVWYVYLLFGMYPLFYSICPKR
ncbi:hypothetical protein ACEQPO_17755 [Bacillus sp. SL00103]